jgi:hypothetical protein
MNLESRLAKLEAVVGRVDLAELTVAELSSHIATLPFQSTAGYAAIIALVSRHPSTMPIAKCVPHGTGA